MIKGDYDPLQRQPPNNLEDVTDLVYHQKG